MQKEKVEGRLQRDIQSTQNVALEDVGKAPNQDVSILSSCPLTQRQGIWSSSAAKVRSKLQKMSQRIFENMQIHTSCVELSTSAPITAEEQGCFSRAVTCKRPPTFCVFLLQEHRDTEKDIQTTTQSLPIPEVGTRMQPEAESSYSIKLWLVAPGTPLHLHKIQ